MKRSYDAIVVGGGLGGLTAGAKLVREGMSVLLIEQHSQPGGCATTFQRGDYTLEVGLHEMDGPGDRDMKRRIFNELGVTDAVEFLKVPEFYRFLHGETDITLPHEADLAAGVLKEHFPGEESGIDAYFNQLLNQKRRKPGEESAPDISVGEFLDSITGNDELKLLLLGNLGYFHDDPYSLSLAYYTIAQGSYYTNGASFIKGGSQQFSDHLAGYIATNGGEVLLNHMATGFITGDSGVEGVTCRKRGRNNESELSFTAGTIVLNISPESVAGWLPGGYSAAIGAEAGKHEPGASLLTVYYGFKGKLSDIGNRHYSTFIFDDSVRNQSDIAPNNRAPFERRSFTFVDYGQVDSGLAPEGKSVGAICCIDYLVEWKNLSKEEYRSKKREVADIFTARMESILPGFGDMTDYCDVGTPLTVERYIMTPGAAVYGFAQLPGRQPFDTGVLPGNIHLASAWGRTGGGFSGAIYGGYLCAMNIIRAAR